jgi:hypothetical protein
LIKNPSKINRGWSRWICEPTARPMRTTKERLDFVLRTTRFHIALTQLTIFASIFSSDFERSKNRGGLFLLRHRGHIPRDACAEPEAGVIGWRVRGPQGSALDTRRNRVFPALLVNVLFNEIGTSGIRMPATMTPNRHRAFRNALELKLRRSRGDMLQLFLADPIGP